MRPVFKGAPLGSGLTSMWAQPCCHRDARLENHLERTNMPAHAHGRTPTRIHAQQRQAPHGPRPLQLESATGGGERASVAVGTHRTRIHARQAPHGPRPLQPPHAHLRLQDSGHRRRLWPRPSAAAMHSPSLSASRLPTPRPLLPQPAPLLLIRGRHLLEKMMTRGKRGYKTFLVSDDYSVFPHT